MTENWKYVTGFHGLYQVSDIGRIKSMEREVLRKNGTKRRVPEIILAIAVQSQGYPVVTLAKNGVNKKFRVSRLVAIEWVPNPENLPEVNHDDGNKLNCCAANLLWVTRSDNMKHAYRTGLRGKPVGYTHQMRTKSIGYETR